MIPIEIINDVYLIRNIMQHDLNDVLYCINQSGENCKTLGRDDYFTYDDLMQRYLETLMNSLEFFCGIYIKKELIGIIKGRIENGIQKELCLMSIIILERYRMKGLGTSVLKAIEEYFLCNFSVKSFCALVMDDNKYSQYFWEKNGYIITRTIKSKDKNEKGIIIYRKEVTKIV